MCLSGHLNVSYKEARQGGLIKSLLLALRVMMTRVCLWWQQLEEEIQADLKWSILVKKKLYSGMSDFQSVELVDSGPFGKVSHGTRLRQTGVPLLVPTARTCLILCQACDRICGNMQGGLVMMIGSVTHKHLLTCRASLSLDCSCQATCN